MNGSAILTATLVIALIGLLIGLLLGAAGKIFAVKTNEAKIRHN